MTIFVFTTAFLISFIMTPMMIRLGLKLGISDKPNGRRQHQTITSRFGGIAIFSGFVGTCILIFILNPPPANSLESQLLKGVIVGAVFVFCYGLLDDFFDLSPKPQFVAQFITACIAIYFSIFIEIVTLPFIGETTFQWFISYPLTIFWVMGMLNTVNFLDGLDGLAAGVATIAVLLFAWHAYSLGQMQVYLFPLALAGACLGFLPFNFYPAKIFMGSTGSLTLGWALASLSILAPAKVATALLVLGIPIIDVAWLMMWRWYKLGSPMVPGRDHLHFRLVDRGFNQRTIVYGYYLFCSIFGILALLMSSRVYKLMALIFLGLLTFVLVWILAKKDSGVRG